MGTLFLSFFATAILVFAGFYLLFRKRGSGKKPLTNGLYWITSIVATPIVYFGVIFLWLWASSMYERKAFDKEQWAEDNEKRYEYVEDLIGSEKLIGLTSEEVKSMLGEPDSEDDTSLVFYIGYTPKASLNLIPDWMEAHLSDGKVDNVRILE